MLTVLTPSIMFLAGSGAVCLGLGSPPPGVGGGPEFEALYNRGTTYAEFRDAATRRKQAWREHYANAEVPDALRVRVTSVPGEWRLLVVAEDWCGDSAHTIPYVAKLVDVAGNLDMRIIDATAGRAIMEANRTPDGRAATPTLILLDANFDEAGCWIERPSKLQAWFLENEPKLESDDLFDQKYAWFDADKGQSTLREIVEMIEAAGAGDPTCGS
jgi:hypothetical protein